MISYSVQQLEQVCAIYVQSIMRLEQQVLEYSTLAVPPQLLLQLQAEQTELVRVQAELERCQCQA